MLSGRPFYQQPKTRVDVGLPQIINIFRGADNNALEVYTLPSHEFLNNHTYLLSFHCRANDGTQITVDSVTGGGLTWALLEDRPSGGQNQRTQLWKGFTSSGATTGSIQINFATLSTNLSQELVYILDRSFGPNEYYEIQSGGSFSTGDNFADISLAAFTDPGNMTYGVLNKHNTEATTEDTNMGELADVTSASWSLQTQWKRGEEPTVSWTWTTAVRAHFIAVELSLTPPTQIAPAVVISGVGRADATALVQVTAPTTEARGIGRTAPIGNTKPIVINETSGFSDTNATSYNTASVAFENETLYLATLVIHRDAGDVAVQQISGGGLNWVFIGEITEGGSIGLVRHMMWYGSTPSGASTGAVTFSDPLSQTNSRAAWSIERVENARWDDVPIANFGIVRGSGTDTGSATFATDRSGLWYQPGTNPQASTYHTVSRNATPEDITPGAGWVELVDVLGSGESAQLMTAWTQSILGLGDSWSTSCSFLGFFVEIAWWNAEVGYGTTAITPTVWPLAVYPTQTPFQEANLESLGFVENTGTTFTPADQRFYTWQNGVPYMLTVFVFDSGSTPDLPTVTGGGLTWTLLAEFRHSTYEGVLAVYHGYAASGATFDDLTFTFASDQDVFLWQTYAMYHAKTSFLEFLYQTETDEHDDGTEVSIDLPEAKFYSGDFFWALIAQDQTDGIPSPDAFGYVGQWAQVTSPFPGFFSEFWPTTDAALTGKYDGGTGTNVFGLGFEIVHEDAPLQAVGAVGAYGIGLLFAEGAQLAEAINGIGSPLGIGRLDVAPLVMALAAPAPLGIGRTDATALVQVDGIAQTLGVGRLDNTPLVEVQAGNVEQRGIGRIDDTSTVLALAAPELRGIGRAEAASEVLALASPSPLGVGRADVVSFVQVDGVAAALGIGRIDDTPLVIVHSPTSSPLGAGYTLTTPLVQVLAAPEMRGIGRTGADNFLTIVLAAPEIRGAGYLFDTPLVEVNGASAGFGIGTLLVTTAEFTEVTAIGGYGVGRIEITDTPSIIALASAQATGIGRTQSDQLVIVSGAAQAMGVGRMDSTPLAIVDAIAQAMGIGRSASDQLVIVNAEAAELGIGRMDATGAVVVDGIVNGQSAVMGIGDLRAESFVIHIASAEARGIGTLLAAPHVIFTVPTTEIRGIGRVFAEGGVNLFVFSPSIIMRGFGRSGIDFTVEVPVSAFVPGNLFVGGRWVPWWPDPEHKTPTKVLSGPIPPENCEAPWENVSG